MDRRKYEGRRVFASTRNREGGVADMLHKEKHEQISKSCKKLCVWMCCFLELEVREEVKPVTLWIIFERFELDTIGFLQDMSIWVQVLGDYPGLLVQGCIACPEGNPDPRLDLASIP